MSTSMSTCVRIRRTRPSRSPRRRRTTARCLTRTRMSLQTPPRIAHRHWAVKKTVPYLLGLLLLAGPDSNLALERSVRLHIRHVPLRPSPSTSSEVSNSAPSSAAADGCVMGSFTCGAARRVQHSLVRRTWPCGHGLPSGYLDFAAVQRGAPNGRSHWRLPLAAGSTAPTSLLPV